jgi:hypothetical protein
MWETLARWAGNSQWRHLLIQGSVGLAILYGAEWLLGPWVKPLIHLGVCQFIGPC